MEKKSLTLWWRLSEGRYVAHRFRIKLDAPTRALVRGMFDGDSLQRALELESINTVEDLQIAKSPLPFEPIEEWLTWTMAGNNVNH